MQYEVYKDRVDAGRKLAAALEQFRGPDALVLGVPRGGVLVGAEVARALDAPLDVVIARKIGAPHQPELAIGAVVSGDHIRVLDEAAIRYLQVPPEYIEAETARQLEEIRRRVEYYRSGRPNPDLRGKTVIVVDDGIATGYTIRAALLGLRRLEPARLVVAVPVAPASTTADLGALADDVVCLQTPEPFRAVGVWYDNFEQNSDEEVVALLSERFRSRAV
ncbi:MAG TPA: phosphoribosyltransferase [Armatimonadota bacterium]|nr:phosphoribosyltransferase [Armatimonadota bacterium]